MRAARRPSRAAPLRPAPRRATQVELHPLNAQRKLVGVALRLGVHSVAYSPLGHSRADLLQHPVVRRVAEEAGRTPAQVGGGGRGALRLPLRSLAAPGHLKRSSLTLTPLPQVLLRWSAQRGVAAIPKAGSEGHVRENIEGLFDWALSYDQKAALDALDCGRRFVAPVAG